ncbi:MAG: hypothetical protein ACJASQ_001373 [Crocinitomicaceae bacterium]|jgi:hypothetical protein
MSNKGAAAADSHNKRQTKIQIENFIFQYIKTATSI